MKLSTHIFLEYMNKYTLTILPVWVYIPTYINSALS